MSLRKVLMRVALVLLGFLSSTAIGNQINVILPVEISDPVVVQLSKKKISNSKQVPSKVLQIYVGKIEQCCSGKMPVAGHYELKDDSLTFTPAFNFIAGQDYVVQTINHESKNNRSEQLTQFNIASDTPEKNAEVTHIFPSADVLPENILRFYIHFATPMQPHVAFDYIKLIDESGRTDDAAFMKFKQELWNEDRTRLTLLIDPGRIKRNVATNLRLGSALSAGKQYELKIKQGWPTADGTSTLSPFSKQFVVSNAIRELPTTDLWKINSPEIGTKDALGIHFDRPFDHQRLHKDIYILTREGYSINGEIQIKNNEYEWQFLPATPWQTDQVLLIVNSKLEDVAGNNFRDLLDHSAETQTINIAKISIPISLHR